MKRAYWLPLAALAVALLAGYAAGVRILIVPPINAVPKGATAVIIGVPMLRPIDSAEGYCRRQRDSDPFCQGGIYAHLGNNAEILLRLPYIKGSERLTGVP